MTDKELNLEQEFLPCGWCGQTISRAAYQKRKDRGLTDLDVCKDCRDVATYRDTERKIKTWKHPKLGVISCLIYAGELNDDWLPIDDEGELFKPGERICGLKDCVFSKHVIPPKVLTVSDIDLIIGLHEMQQHNKRARAR